MRPSAHGHRGKVQAKDLAKTKGGTHLPRTGALHKCAMGQRSGKPDVKKCQGEVRRRSQLTEKSQKLTLWMLKREKSINTEREDQSKSPRNPLKLAGQGWVTDQEQH